MTKILEGLKEMGWVLGVPSNLDPNDGVTHLFIGEQETLEEFEVEIYGPARSDN